MELSALIFLYVSRSNFPTSKSKNNLLLKSFLYFRKWNFLGSSLKKSCFFFHYFLFRCFHFTNFLYHDCFLLGTSLLCCCTASTTDLREFFYSEALFTLHSFPTFGTACFYQGFPGTRQFFLQGCRASH